MASVLPYYALCASDAQAVQGQESQFKYWSPLGSRPQVTTLQSQESEKIDKASNYFNESKEWITSKVMK